MVYPTHKNSPLPRYILLSVGLHILFLAGFALVREPKKQEIKITLNIGGQVNASMTDTLPVPEMPITATKPIELPKPTTPEKKQVAPKKPTPPPIIKEKASIPKEIQKTVPLTPVKEKLEPTPVKPIEPIPVPTQHSPSKTTTSESAPLTPPVPEVKESDIIANELDQLLQKKQSSSAPSAKKSFDVLSDASWSGSPRKTILFPNISSQIPQEYKSRGFGYSVTAKITFSPQGWVSAVELIRTSGDPRIDSIFRNELRKIRIEESKTSSYDTIIKSFTISIK